MSFTTWVRVEDAFGQYDHPKGADLPAGASLVEGYLEHVGPVAREPKAFTDKTGAPVSREQQSYDRLNITKLKAEIGKRTKDGREIDPAGDTRADLVAALVADDAAQAAQQTTDTTEVPGNTSGDAAGSEI